MIAFKAAPRRHVTGILQLFRERAAERPQDARELKQGPQKGATFSVASSTPPKVSPIAFAMRNIPPLPCHHSVLRGNA